MSARASSGRLNVDRRSIYVTRKDWRGLTGPDRRNRNKLTTEPFTRLSEVINARGTFTPLGVSRSSPAVSAAVADALSRYVIIDEIQELASQRLARFSGAEAATVTHCTAASITLSIAAVMTGTSPKRIAALPDTTGMPDGVVLPAGHCVNYGQSILQAIRLSGATPILAGSSQTCDVSDIERQIESNDPCCLLLVSSKLVQTPPVDFSEAIKIARKHGVATIIDGAAQDFRIEELMQTGADLVLVSAQKYLMAPTAGLVFGKKRLIEGVRAQEKGIGRGMKASKEAIAGILASVEEREHLVLDTWREMQDVKVAHFVQRSGEMRGISSYSEADPTGLPFSRAYLIVDAAVTGLDASTLAIALKSGQPSIWANDTEVSDGKIGFELVQIANSEIEVILTRLFDILS